MPRSGVIVVLIALWSGGCRGGRDATLGDGGLGATMSDANPFPSLDGGSAGYALSFDGVKDYATAANANFPAAGEAQTIEMWFKSPPVSATAYIDLLVARLDYTNGVQIGFRNGELAVWRVYVDRVLAHAPAPAANSWHHVAYTFDGTGGTSAHVLYVDGVAVDSESTTADERTPTTVWLGSLDGSSRLYTGLMDEVRVWSVARTAAQVAADRAHTSPGASPGLVAYWTFDDVGGGGRAQDASGNNNTVTLGDGVAERMPSRVVSDAPLPAVP